MPHTFDDAALTGVLGHMNSDHTDDNLLITRAFAPSVDVVAATMVTFDGDAGQWRVTTGGGEEQTVRIPWLGGPITERREVRREVVALYDEACARLGVAPRPHD
ncbi:DUF2470 domain-containing protein [Microbacterium sp. W1N]|uniref:DUF2470 domain-containing protein n=1 Tax=Microbacterium festucae TaxID=2977531 RepID=UPI0021BE09F2|nr:DUF2470 domain-containing protein [Microbacterium festucae]MCT9819562.1 DUF2470 domain-containing protein [Microbacterium festucae]